MGRVERLKRWDKKSRWLTFVIAMGSVGIICFMGYNFSYVGKEMIKKAANQTYIFFCDITQDIIENHYPNISYHWNKKEQLQDAFIKKIGQIIPLGFYMANNEKTLENQTWNGQEDYPMMQPEEVKVSEENEVVKETENNEENETDNVEAYGTVIESQNEILLQIKELSLEGGYTLEQMTDYEYLTNHLYVIDPSTSITEQELNPKILLAKDLSIETSSLDPQILIYHTHSQETFIDSVPGKEEDSIVGVGNYLTEILTNTYGYNVLHHKGIYDMTDGVLDRDPAYEKALPDLEQILNDNPSIEVVIDLHRDGVDEDVHLVTDIDGVPTAKLMFFNGTCRDTVGERTDITNPYREDNLAFSLQMALAAEAKYPDLTRVIYLKTNRYNQHLRSRSALVEVGAQTNTVEEAYNAMPILADLIHQVIQRDG